MKPSILASFIAILLSLSVSAQETKPIELTISIPGLGEKEFIVGENIPLQVTLKNTTAGPIYILPPLDGSTYGRYPRYTQTVIRPLPVDYVPDGLICGTFNPLRHEDFALLQARESYTLPYPIFGWKPYTAGEYEVSLRIDFNGTPEQYRSAPIGNSPSVSPEILEKLNQVPKVELESNQVKVNVVSNGKTLDPRVYCLMGMTREEVRRLFDSVEFLDDICLLKEMTSRGMGIQLHFSNRETVDGVLMDRIIPGKENDLLIWSRGLEDTQQEKVTWFEIWDGFDATYMYSMILTGWYLNYQSSAVTFSHLYK